MKISQSGLRDFYDPEYCQIKWIEVYKNGHRNKPTNAMLDGLVFEQMTIGMSRGGEVYEIPKLKNGNPSKRETDLIKLADEAKETLKKLKIKLVDVQPEWETEDMIGHPDALIKIQDELAIMDLKYTGTREDESARWNPYAWNDLEYKDFSQAVHYIEMYYRLHGLYLPFIYMVFGKSGWVKAIAIDLTEDKLTEYKIKLNNFKKDIKNFKAKPINKYTICKKCMIECKHRTKTPDFTTITY
tara:strand:+ start:21309 stop:22034 length:726 start_codon:yes stop_codon:yes gene_type:complete